MLRLAHELAGCWFSDAADFKQSGTVQDSQTVSRRRAFAELSLCQAHLRCSSHRLHSTRPRENCRSWVHTGYHHLRLQAFPKHRRICDLVLMLADAAAFCAASGSMASGLILIIVTSLFLLWLLSLVLWKSVDVNGSMIGTREVMPPSAASLVSPRLCAVPLACRACRRRLL